MKKNLYIAYVYKASHSIEEYHVFTVQWKIVIPFIIVQI